MGFFWFLLGLVVGAVAAWVLLARRYREELDAALRGWEERCRAAREEVDRVDREHAEVRARLEERIAELERERKALKGRIGALEARIAELERRAAEGVPERAGAEGPPASAAESAQAGAEGAPAGAPGEELQRIRGLGPVIAAKLVELGYARLSDIATLKPEDVARIEEAIGFPGRVARERWIEQARELLAAGG